MSTSLEQLMRGIQNAVVQASHRMRDEQGRLIREFFDTIEVPATADDPGGPTTTRYEPKLARFALPVEDGGGQRVKDIWVPLITMVPQSSLVIDEVRIVTEIELSVEEGEAVQSASTAMATSPSESAPPPARLLARSPGGSARAAASPMAAAGTGAPTGTSKTLVEIRLKSDPQASGLDTFLSAYNDALRKQLP